MKKEARLRGDGTAPFLRLGPNGRGKAVGDEWYVKTLRTEAAHPKLVGRSAVAEQLRFVHVRRRKCVLQQF